MKSCLSGFSRFGQWVSELYVESVEPFFYRYRVQRRLHGFGVGDVGALPKAVFDLHARPSEEDDRSTQWVARYERYYQRFSHLSGGMIRRGFGHVAVLPTAEIVSIEAYRRRLSKRSGNFKRDAERALKLGYQACPIRPEEHIGDMVAIRRSKWFRSFGPVLDAALLSPMAVSEELSRTAAMRDGNRMGHWERWWGVFAPASRVAQDGTGPQRLVAFACVHRIGRVARYAQFLGHGEHLRYGIMMALHNAVAEALLDARDPSMSGVHYLTYGAIEQGSKGLAFWKRKALFEPRVIVFPSR